MGRGTPTWWLLRCANGRPLSTSVNEVSSQMSDIEVCASACNEESECDISPGVMVNEVCETSALIGWSEDKEGICGQQTCGLEDAVLAHTSCLQLLADSRDHLTEPNKSFAFDKADNSCFLPFMHECWCFVYALA